MKVQSLERSFDDKLFAICDYKLYPRIAFNKDLQLLFQQVRGVRAATNSCPSAAPGIDINELLKEISEKDFFKKITKA